MYTKMIKKYIDSHWGKIFDASYLYDKLFQIIPNKTYLKIIERFVDAGLLQRISKGVYIIGEQKDNTDFILDFYTSNYNGMIIGSRMFYNLGIIDCRSEEIEVLTSKITTKTKNINNYKLKYSNMFFIPETIKVIEGLESIANYSFLKDINYNKYTIAIEGMIKEYDDLTFEIIIKDMKYDYATIEALSKLLSERNISNKAIEIYNKIHQ